MQHEVGFGNSVQLVGSADALGSWQLSDALTLQWTEGHVWEGVAMLPPGTYEFKGVAKLGDRQDWEPGCNRVIQVPRGADQVTVACQWQQTADTQVEVHTAQSDNSTQHASTSVSQTTSGSSLNTSTANPSSQPAESAAPELSSTVQHTNGTSWPEAADVLAGPTNVAAGFAGSGSRRKPANSDDVQRLTASWNAGVTSTSSSNGASGTLCERSSNATLQSANPSSAPQDGAEARVASLRLVMAAHMIPHEAKAANGGEDAFFISASGAGALGVADGVSGWNEEGINPAEFSRSLMRHAASALEAAGTNAVELRSIIDHAQNSTNVPGSATMCLAVLTHGNLLQVANVGDSGVRVVRAGQLVYASQAQVHGFNIPFQLGHPSFLDNCDTSACAALATVQLQAGDVVLAATDGLFDNLFDDEIVQLVSDSFLPPVQRKGLTPSPEEPQAPNFLAWLSGIFQAPKDTLAYSVGSTAHASELAATLASTAQRHSRNDTRRMTPWLQSLQQQKVEWASRIRSGGKMDDITVVVAMVVA